MSETPKKILFMMIKDSARLFVMASSVAFMDSDESYKKGTTHTAKRKRWNAHEVKYVEQCQQLELKTYNSFFLDDVNRRIDVMFVRQFNSHKGVQDA